MMPSWPGAFNVQDAPWWCSNTAEADGKQERSYPLAAEGCVPFSDDACGGPASAVFMSNGAVGCNDALPGRVSTVMPLACARGSLLVAVGSALRVVCS